MPWATTRWLAHPDAFEGHEPVDGEIGVVADVQVWVWEYSVASPLAGEFRHQRTRRMFAVF